MASTESAAIFKTVRRSWLAKGVMNLASQPFTGCDFKTLSITIFSGQGSNRFVAPSPTTASNPTVKALACGLSKSDILTPFDFAGISGPNSDFRQPDSGYGEKEQTRAPH